MRRSRDAGLRANLVEIGLSFISEARGQHQEAVAELTRGLTVELRELPAGTAEGGVLGDAHARDQALAAIKRYLATRPKVLPGAVIYALLRLGRPREAVELIGMGSIRDDVADSLLWSPWGREARRGRVSNLRRHSPEAELGWGGCRGEGERPGGKPQVLEDGLGGGGAKHDGHDAPRASAARAGEDVGLERPLEELSPGNGAARPAWADALGCRRARGSLGSAGAGEGGAGTTRGRNRALGAKTPK